MKNHYKTLGIDNFTTSQRQIKQAYKQLMLIHHPDKTKNQTLINIGMQIIQAYNILIDQKLRKQYDEKLQQSISKINNITNKHYNIVGNKNKNNSQEEKDGDIILECQQCYGQTLIKYEKFCEGKHMDLYAHCDHCGLLMKIQ